MTATTHVGSAQGPVHSGSGALHVSNYYGHLGVSAAPDSGGRDPRQVAREELRGLCQRFVAPAGSELARMLLADKRAVMLTADRGNGAPTAATVFLCELPEGYRRFRELVDQAEEEGWTGRALDEAHVEEGAALLLDLSSIPSGRYGACMAELPGLLKVVRERRAWLAVVLPQERRAGFDRVLQQLVVPLGRPDPAAVLQRHLRGYGIRVSLEELTGQELRQVLATATMTETADLAEDIRNAQESAPPESGFASWLASALAARAPGAQDVARHLSELEGGAQRALLLTAAMLHGARTDTVHEAAALLARTLEHPEVATPLLHHRTLTDRLAGIKATARDGLVRFDMAGYDAGVRHYFWDNYPQVRGPLADWLSQSPRFPTLRPRDQLDLVTRFTQECLRTGPPRTLLELTERWSRTSATQAELAMAARALGEGVVHAGYGSHFRRHLYRWAQDAALPSARAHVLIGVCSEVLSRRFPDQAMIRLRHLSRHRDPAVRGTAREALVRITDSDDRLYHSLLCRLRPGGDTPGLRDLAVFLDLADPSRMPDDKTVRALLADHWTAALTHLGPDRWGELSHAWLAHAQARPEHRRAVLSTLATACARQRAAFGSVYTAACAWAAVDPARKPTVDVLWRATACAGHPRPPRPTADLH